MVPRTEPFSKTDAMLQADANAMEFCDSFLTAVRSSARGAFYAFSYVSSVVMRAWHNRKKPGRSRRLPVKDDWTHACRISVGVEMIVGWQPGRRRTRAVG